MSKRDLREKKHPKTSETLKSKLREILGLILIPIAIFIIVALVTHYDGDWPGSSRAFDEPYHNKVGWLGAFISYHMLRGIGFTSYAFAVLLGITGIIVFLHKSMKILIKPFVFFSVTGLFLPLIWALTVDIGADNTRVESAFESGGVLGGLIAHYMVTYMGRIGAFLVSVAAILISIVITTNLKPSSGVEFIIGIFKPVGAFIAGIFSRAKLRGEEPRRKPSEALEQPPEDMDEAEYENPFLTPLEKKIPERMSGPSAEPTINYKVGNNNGKISVKKGLYKNHEGMKGTSQATSPEDLETEEIVLVKKKAGTPAFEYVFPKSDLFGVPQNDAPSETRDEMLEQAQRIVESLRHFNIESEVRQITPGPIVTRYELTIAPGIKVGKVVGLSNDLTMALRAKGGIRIIAPIPGKAAIGIEVPNKARSIVYFREIAESEPFQSSDKPLVLAIGKNTSGDPIVADLAKMPHLLIAGSTGSGKSVCIHTIIASILMKASPHEVRIIMIDPKVVELSIYNPIPHLLTPVITDTKRATGSLKWAVREMETRYRRLAFLGVRDIYQYNEKVHSMLNAAPVKNQNEPMQYGKREEQNETDSGNMNGETQKNPEPLPFIVIIIDEFADLMVVASNEIEESIARLAQMARAVGIHLVLATQRPSADVITGLIKANFPSRIAFKVMQASNSRIILDESGADKLLGMGDMLFLQSGKPESVRLHGAFISGDECQRLVDFITSHSRGKTEQISAELFDEESEDESSMLGFRNPDERDSLFFEAARLVVRHNQGSVSLLQRRLKIGYARAARLIDQLEMNGIVSAYDGSKAREVLVDEMYIDALEAGEL